MGQKMRNNKWVIYILITSLILILAIMLFTWRRQNPQQNDSVETKVRSTTEVIVEAESSEAMSTTEVLTIEVQTTELESTDIYTTEIATAEPISIEATTEAISEVVTEPYVRPFAEYIEQNTDFAGWITVEGTTIDAPIVQSVDNEYYLIHDYTGARNITGAIYMDYKNLGNFYDNHISLYGHYMTDGSIFHDLHYFKDQTFFENNDTITIHGLRESKEFEIFSVHVVSAYTYYLYLDLDDDALVEYAKHFKRLSMYERDVAFPKDLQLLTLVTCTYEYDNARILIHAFAK